MKDLRNIWQRLQDHEVTPPGEVYFRLLQLLENENKNDDIKISNALRNLNEYEVQPPVPAQAIIKRITLNSSKQKTGNFTNIIKLHRYKLIAASLLLASAAWGIFQTINVSTDRPLAVKVNNTAIPGINDTSVSMQGHQASDSSTSNDPADHPGPLKSTGVHSQPFKQMRINGQWISLTDNDIFVTFTSFEYNNVPGILATGNDKDIPVHLDKYSNIVITKNMSGMLKEMYQVKTNGNPTRKARKAREKLEKWKKADESFFDKSKGRNPLDPIDMAEFIFK